MGCVKDVGLITEADEKTLKVLSSGMTLSFLLFEDYSSKSG